MKAAMSNSNISKNYNPRVISMFEIIGCYFVDVYYNHLYLTSKDNYQMREKSPSLTDEYKSAVRAYKIGVSSDERYYKKTITGLHNYVQTCTKYTSISLTEFVNLVLEQFLPEEHFAVLNEGDRSFFLQHIIKTIIENFTRELLDPKSGLMTLVIDKHTVDDNIAVWKDKFKDVQIMLRENIFAEFTVGRESEKADQRVVERLWKQLEDTLAAKCDLEGKLENAKKIAEVLYRENADLKKRIRELELPKTMRDSYGIMRAAESAAAKPENVKPESASKAPSASRTPRSAASRSSTRDASPSREL